MTDQKDPKKPKKVITPDQMAKMTPDQLASYMNRLRAENFKPDASEPDNSKTARGAEEPSKKAKIDPLNPPKDMTTPQVTKWLNLGLKFHARNKAAEQAAREAKAKAQAEAAARAQIKAEKIATVYSQIKAPKITAGGTAKFLFMPEINISFRGLHFAASLLIQAFAQTLISVGLLPPNHPGRTLIAAKTFSIFQILEEARLNLLPIKLALTALNKLKASEISALAAKQYAVFASLVGLLITGGASILVMFVHIVFGATHAFAQPVNTGGNTIGNFTIPVSGDLGSAVIDAIFGTGASSQSLVMSGLGAMLSFYSTMILTFAGIVVLWIIISAVAETARTGIPFGKQFNHVWAPIRLVVALGLLVPLGSGLNSGQYIALSLAKWGSTEASQVWGIFAQKMIATSGSGQVSSGLSSIPFNIDKNRTFANQLFQTVLCQQVNNIFPNNVPVTQNTIGTISVAPAAVSAGVNGTTLPTAPLNTPSQIGWYSQDANGNKITDCGGLTIQTPNLPAMAQVIVNQSNQGNNAASATINAQQSIMANQSNAAAQFVQNTTPLANAIAQAAMNTPSNGSIALNTTNAYNQYQSAFESYVNTQTSGITNILNNYNTGLNTALTQSAQSFGWIYAPVWLSNIAASNGAVADTAQIVPTVTVPSAQPFTADGTTGGAWYAANSFLARWEPANLSAHTPPKAQTFNSVATAIQDMTSKIGSNPLGQAGIYGRQLLTLGFEIIEPANMINCYQNPFSDPANCAYVLQDALTQANKNGGSWNGLNTSTIQGMMANPGASGNLSTYQGAFGLDSHMTFLPDQTNLSAGMQKMLSLAGEGTSTHTVLFPIGMIMISIGFLLMMLTLIPLARFVLGILNWLILIFEAVLAMPLASLTLLRTEGEGFATQQFQSCLMMLFGVVIRPMLMTLGLVLAIIAFNAIMEIVNILFAPTVANLNPGSDASYLTLGVYMIFYGTLAYTLANSAFKAIDILPNFVMGWIGQRMENRVDDASMVQQQAQSYMQTMAYSSRGGAGAASGYDRQQAAQQWQHQQSVNQQILGQHGFTGPNAQADLRVALSNPQSPNFQNALQAEQAMSNPNNFNIGSTGGAGGGTGTTAGGSTTTPSGGTQTASKNPPPKVDPGAGGQPGGS